MFKKTVSILLSFTMLLSVLLSGCGKPASGSSSQSSGVQATPTAAPAEIAANLRILFPGTSEVEKNWSASLQNAVKAKYPKINIEYLFLTWTDLEQKLSVMNAAKDYPDMTMTQDVTNFVAMGALEPLDAYFELKDSAVKTTQFPQGILDYSKIDGKTYSVPLLGIAYALAVNKVMLADVGMKPEDLKTWDDMKKAAQLMTKNGKYGYTVAAGNGRFVFRDATIVGLSNDLVPNDTTAASKKKYLEVLGLYKDLINYMPSKTQVTWLYPDMFKAFCNGDVGMLGKVLEITVPDFEINSIIVLE